ncbi:GNAT family N-acetyltransferase [Phytomonospora sp. NPDC050363]|uniref:GNAT family N-acetyltransferase n=1 Tax=Phytomonospora sp. NPDC050363 TaxID=3155642 RepID=UPI00340FCE90
MKISRIDLFDDAVFNAWHAAASEGVGAGRHDPPLYSAAQSAVAYRATDGPYDYELYGAVVDGEIVGTVRVELPKHDNRTLADIEVAVVPAHRRRGIGSALFEHVAERVAELGRTSILGVVNQPIGADEVPGYAFASKFGLTRRNVEMRRILPLPLPEGLLDRLEAKAAAKVGGYRLHAWSGACPEEYAEQYANLKSLLMSEAPNGEMDYEPEVWDVARLRADEKKTEAQGRDLLTVIAVAPGGEIAGHTQLALTREGESRVYQWDTLVLPEHRGHRLGLALKVANLRALVAGYPGRSGVETWNAVQNGPMVSVNLELGFREVERYEEWQRG